MTSEVDQLNSARLTRRSFLILPLAVWANQLLAADAPSVPSTPSRLPPGACPLNSGGPSLLGSRWFVMSIYNNPVPKSLRMTMLVEQTAMVGTGGCNNYTANFVQVGNRGFKVNQLNRGEKPCEVLRVEPGKPTVDVGSWEGKYLRVLRRAGSVQQLGTTLQFYDFNGKPSLIFGKIYGSPTPIPTT